MRYRKAYPEDIYTKRKGGEGLKLSAVVLNLSERGLIALSHKLSAEELQALENGYKDMGGLNSGLAEMCIDADNEALHICEEYLTRECE